MGLTAFTAGGPGLVAELAQSTDVFVDLKLHDIPAQVEGAVISIAGLGARYTTVHATGGEAMLRAAVDAAQEAVTLLAVTVLTSLEGRDLVRLGGDGDVSAQVLRLAELALGCGIPGIVCSPLEVAAVRQRFGPLEEGGPLVVVPGIRAAPGGDDQRRTHAPRAALAAGADVLVVGRPITAAADPRAAARELLEELAA